jgi:hypothetical protein
MVNDLEAICSKCAIHFYSNRNWHPDEHQSWSVRLRRLAAAR